jgi:macrodomain Ter protein organizer (MatP/YcbG family)
VISVFAWPWEYLETKRRPDGDTVSRYRQISSDQ